MLDDKNKPVKKVVESIEIFMESKTANTDEVREQLQKLYKDNEVFETSIAKNGVRLLSYEIYGNLNSRSNSTALHKLMTEIIKIQGTVQFKSTDGTLFVLDSLSKTVELSSTTFKLSEYNKNTNTK